MAHEVAAAAPLWSRLEMNNFGFSFPPTEPEPQSRTQETVFSTLPGNVCRPLDGQIMHKCLVV